MVRILLAFMLFLISPTSLCQNNVANQYGGWIVYKGNHKLFEKFSLHTEYQMRRNDFGASIQQSISRIGLDYHFNNKHSLTTGYAFVEFFPYGTQPILTRKKEHRFWQQYIYKWNYRRIFIKHRFRLEHRFMENAYLDEFGQRKVDGFTLKQRIRYNFNLAITLNHKEMIDQTLFIGLYNEVFISFGKNSGENIFHQNQFYAGLGWKFNSKTKLLFGYLNQVLVMPNMVDVDRNHNLRLVWVYNLNFRSKK